ncbi:MAG TPA: dihydropteroate synthase, partial [bacterium]|nr:dihydropteroate synthase [bacterium]
MKIRNLEIGAGPMPAIMGILNVTPDSFSDGGLHFLPSDAISHALKLIDEGADIIDIGGESTRPGSSPVSEDEEIDRVIPIIEGLRSRSEIPISIDTSKSAVAKAAIEAGADLINDISAGRFDPEIFELAALHKKPICLMHMKGLPKNMQDNPHYDDLIFEISGFLSEAASFAISKGVPSELIILDPGIGFGKSADDNLSILRNIGSFKSLGFPLLIGTSNKSFIGKKLGLDVKDRLEASLATIPACMNGGASILRMHDVKAT